MRLGSVLIEALAIVGLALVLGTGVHLFRPDRANRIEWVKKYENCFTVKKLAAAPDQPPAPPTPPPAPPVQPLAPVEPKSPASKAPAVVQEPRPTLPAEATALPEGVQEITVDAAKAEFDAGTTFIDARRTRQFEQGHIKGARSVSAYEGELDKRIEALLGEVPQEAPLVVYCTGGDCEDSHQLAKDLKNAGFKDLRIMKDGIKAWRERKFPMEGSEGAPAGGAGEEEGQ